MLNAKCINSEIVVNKFEDTEILYAFHDIDGTHSLIRDWPPVMSICLYDVIEKGLADRATLIMDGHEKMKKYAQPETADVICFNFGYLPGGDHSIATRAESSIRAIEEGLSLLKINGIMNLCIYSGGDTGYEERDAILEYVKELDTKKWLVIMSSFYNRKNDPPIPVFIIRLK